MLKDDKDGKEAAIRNWQNYQSNKLSDLEFDAESDQEIPEEPSSLQSMPFNSDSDSVYDHCQKHFLESDESNIIEMQFGHEAYHI